MSLREEKSANKSRPNYITAIVSITLVLLNLGILSVAILLSKDLPNSIKEDLEFQIELNDGMSDDEVSAFTTKIENSESTKAVEFVSKGEAAEIMQGELGEDFKGLLGYNPLYSSLNLKLKSEYLKNEEIEKIIVTLKESGYVKSVSYDSDMIDIINNYSGKIIIPLVAFALLLFIIALFLIDSTIRLSMYSKRFLVRSMKLVGATEWFIMKPFIKSGVIIGAISGVLASTILITVVFPLIKVLLNVSVLDNVFNYSLIIVFLIILGILISLISTKRAVNKYLKLKLDDLY